MTDPTAGDARTRRHRIPPALFAVAAVLAIIGAILPSSPASAVPMSQSTRALGVSGIQYGTSPATAPYLGAYRVSIGGVAHNALCVEHAGSAPNPADGAYGFVGNAVTDDAYMKYAVNVTEWITNRGYLAVFLGDTALAGENIEWAAAAAAIAHYRADQLGLPGETAYGGGAGPANPTGPESFLISDHGVVGWYGGFPSAAPVQAADVADKAWQLWVMAGTLPMTPFATIGAHPNVDGGEITAEIDVDVNDPFDVLGADGYGVTLGVPTVTNATNVQFWADPAHTIPAVYTLENQYRIGGQETPYSAPRIYVTANVVDGSAPVTISGVMATVGETVQYAQPVDAGEQNVMISGSDAWKLFTATAEPTVTPPTLTVTKTSTGGLPVGGIQFAVTNAGGLDLGTITVNADGTSNILPIDLGWLGTNVTLTEVASTAWSTGHSPAAPVTVTIAEGPNTVQVANTPATTEISVTKQDADRTDQHSLAGAHVSVRKDTDADGSFETLVDEGDTLEDGFLVIDGLTIGSYQVEEVTPPSGYTYGAVRTITFVVQGGAGGLEIVGLDGFEDMDGDGNADDVQFENQKPGITTQVVQDGSPAGAGPISVRNGTMVRDQATLTGVAAGTAGTIVTQAYGPFATRDEITAASCTAAKAGPSVTDTVTGPGPHVSSTLDLAAGHWVLVETWTDNTPGSTATATHVCNDTNEMIEVVPNVTVGTTATPKSQTVGGSNVDTAHVAGTNGADWEIVLKVYGPFKTVDDVNDTVCVDTNMAYTVTYTGTGDGDFPSPEFTLPSAGIYTMVESITTDDGRTATHKCGDTDETVEITPGVLTTARSGDLVVGAPQADVLSLTGVPEGEEATVVLRVYGPFASVDAVNDTVCVDDNLVWEDEFTVVGSGSHVSPEFVLDAPGVYTMVETVTYGGVTGAHACGDTHETFNVREPEETTTTTTTSTTVPDSTTTTVPATTTTTIKSSGGGGGNGGGGGLAYTGSSILYTVALAFGLTAGGLALFGVRKRRS